MSANLVLSQLELDRFRRLYSGRITRFLHFWGILRSNPLSETSCRPFQVRFVKIVILKEPFEVTLCSVLSLLLTLLSEFKGTLRSSLGD